MRDNPLSDRTSWAFLAAMHGFDEGLWNVHGMPTTPLPPRDDRKLFWDQCQHLTWFFLPWHRGYLAAFEAILRDHIVRLKGPADWSLPYWNYHGGEERATWLPPAFADETWPDGGPNPLKVSRWGANADDASGPTVDITRAEQRTALRTPNFASDDEQAGGAPGFGGPVTDFIQYGPAFGEAERSPHGLVHTMIGGFVRDGSGRRVDGIMSDPETAGYDPIFWLHHCNIDRLWSVWMRRNAAHLNPVDLRWTEGPLIRRFTMPAIDGSAYEFVAGAMVDSTVDALGYDYDDVADPLGGGSRLSARLLRAGVGELGDMALAQGPAERIGESGSLTLTGRRAAATVAIDPIEGEAVASGIRSLRAGRLPKGTEPDRIFLNLEGIKSRRDSLEVDVYVNLPAGVAPEDHPEAYAGTLSFFGVRKASLGNAEHGGNGVTQVLEITELVDELVITSDRLARLEVELVANDEIVGDEVVSIDRVSVYRQRP
ncbi:MAG TPA: tyrosinase family protein [Brevundimonas sp.]|jgi:tyrosinase